MTNVNEWISNASNEELLKEYVSYASVDVFVDKIPWGLSLSEFEAIRKALKVAVLNRMNMQ